MLIREWLTASTVVLPCWLNNHTSFIRHWSCMWLPVLKMSYKGPILPLKWLRGSFPALNCIISFVKTSTVSKMCCLLHYAACLHSAVQITPFKGLAWIDGLLALLLLTWIEMCSWGIAGIARRRATAFPWLEQEKKAEAERGPPHPLMPHWPANHLLGRVSRCFSAP